MFALALAITVCASNKVAAQNSVTVRRHYSLADHADYSIAINLITAVGGIQIKSDLAERVEGMVQGKAKVTFFPTNYSNTAERSDPHSWSDILDEHGLGEGLDEALGRGGLSDLLFLFFEILSMAPAIDLEKGDHYELKFALQTGQVRETGKLADVKEVNGRNVAFFETTVAIPVPKSAGVGTSLLPIKESGPRFAYLQVKRQLDVATGKLLKARASFLRGVPRTRGTITLQSRG